MRPARDDSGPASDLEMEVEFAAYGPASFDIFARWEEALDGTPGWFGDAMLTSALIGGKVRPREWLADAFGKDAVAEWESAAWEEWMERNR